MTGRRGERMRGAGEAALRLVAVASGLGLVWMVSAGAAPSSAATDMLLATVAVVAVASSVALVAAVTSLLLALVAGASGGTPPSSRALVELPVSVTQSRPDAPGNPQPRAPGRLLAVV